MRLRMQPLRSEKSAASWMAVRGWAISNPGKQAEIISPEGTWTITFNPTTQTMNEIPRRAYINKMVPAELKIREAMLAVEAMPADVRLTEAVVLLGEASAKVSDFVDDVSNSATPLRKEEA